MSQEPEWAINPRGEVMLVISPPLSHAPVRGHLAGRDRYVLSTDAGENLPFTPNRKVAGAIRRGDSVLVVELASPDDVLRSTVVPTGEARTPEAPRFA